MTRAVQRPRTLTRRLAWDEADDPERASWITELRPPRGAVDVARSLTRCAPGVTRPSAS